MLNKVTHPLKCATSQFNVLDDVINTLRFRGSIFFHSSLAAPWGMSLASIATPRFHVALEGGFFIGAGDQQIAVKAMDIVMLPTGNMHWIADQVDRTLVPSEQAGNACELGQPLFQTGVITNRVMCGLVEYDKAITHPFIDALPPVFHLANLNDDDSIWLTVKLIDAEITCTQRKKSIIIDRLTEVLFIKMLNHCVEQNEHLSGFLAALQEPRLKRVLQQIHQFPEKQWSLELLSDIAGMSRATLSRKFKTALDVSPMTYVSRWRMAKAYQLLQYSRSSLEQIAEAIGYADARTFIRSFLHQYGVTPSQLRKTTTVKN